MPNKKAKDNATERADPLAAQARSADLHLHRQPVDRPQPHPPPGPARGSQPGGVVAGASAVVPQRDSRVVVCRRQPSLAGRGRRAAPAERHRHGVGAVGARLLGQPRRRLVVGVRRLGRVGGPVTGGVDVVAVGPARARGPRQTGRLSAKVRDLWDTCSLPAHLPSRTCKHAE